MVGRRGTYVLPAVGDIAVVLNLLARDRGHSATCNWHFRIDSKFKMFEIELNDTLVKSGNDQGSSRHT